MAGVSLLALLDDIATVLDDVAVMTKVAARKTAGVLGDDLALNAQQVSGVRAEREIPVVLAVAKGSLRNKCILVPAALLISAVAPWLITPMLLVGGLFLCFEGAEKILEKYVHHGGAENTSVNEDEDSPSPLNDEAMSPEELQALEQKKIAGAIRTDFILSAEIIVIALGTVQTQAFVTQLVVVSLIALVMTIGVYGLVAGIVKLDDAGFYFVAHSEQGQWKHKFGHGLVQAAPYLMKALAVIGTIAMFLVGGGIVVHSIPAIHHFVDAINSSVATIPMVGFLLPAVINGVIGIVAGLLVLLAVEAYKKVKQ
ncbi:hypothetical protein A3K86_20280 [Photobacterium jeanii]|uniref:ABC transporter n=1 Tax=Photobacterium jeanii TaxID=858640 RepID=A0A178K2G3_9GAMM|nr:DUF808 domain-containing protein [Photobacterium jeanii]OAN11296.1 hypothetical protein A3K86_20280 [Photobacterium jeanii]PST90816.1 DUF808 domain-containing protein [Photobacterium jeanii]